MISFREYDADLMDKLVVSDENKHMIKASKSPSSPGVAGPVTDRSQSVVTIPEANQSKRTRNGLQTS